MRLELAPSRALAALVVAAHALAAAAAWIALPTVLGAALAAALVSLGVAAAWSRALLRAGGSPRAVEIAGEDCALELRNGQRLAVPPKGRRYVTRYLVAIPLGPLARTVLLTADMLSAAEFRRLRIWALWRRLPRTIS